MEVRAGLGEELVAAITGAYGEHPGYRAAHAKGTCVTGTFTSGEAAAALTRAAHLHGQPVPVTVRFSNGTGRPGVPDHAADGRGIAVKFHLPDGASTDMVGLTLPVFFVRTPDDFVKFIGASRRDPETGQYDLALIGAFLQDHPETTAAFGAQMGLAPRASYLDHTFYGIHTFRFVSAAGETRDFRYRWVPEAAGDEIDKDQAKELGADYLRDDLLRRAGDGSAFRLLVQLAEPGDPLDDPTAAWPEERELVQIGRMVITGVPSDPKAECEDMVFDPTSVVDGVECSDDPILHARSAAYSVSLARRRGLSPAAQAAAKPAADLESLQPGQMATEQVGDELMAVANVGGVLHRFQDTCTHRQCSLSEGVLEGATVTCPCHGSQFDVRTGAVLRGPAREPLKAPG